MKIYTDIPEYQGPSSDGWSIDPSFLWSIKNRFVNDCGGISLVEEDIENIILLLRDYDIWDVKDDRDLYNY